MENLLEKEVENRQQQIELNKDLKEVNEINNEDLNKYDIIAYADGACRQKFDVGSGAFVIYDNKLNELYSDVKQVDGAVTNNICEYWSLIWLLQYLLEKQMNKKRILLVMDSQLVINQLKRVYSVNNEGLLPLFRKVTALKRFFNKMKLLHVTRKFNARADELAQGQLHQYVNNKKEVKNTLDTLNMQIYNVTMQDDLSRQQCQICGQHEPEDEIMLCDHCSTAFHYQCINLQSIPIGNWFCTDCQLLIQQQNQQNSNLLDPAENDWLIDYLRDPEVIEDYPLEIQQEVLILAQNFRMIENKLYFQEDSGLKRVPMVGERQLLVKQIHQSVGHFGYLKTLGMVRQVYWWPQMAKQIKEVLSKCLMCQSDNARYPQLSRSYAINKGTQPFTQVVVDLFYLPQTPDGFRYVAVAVDSFTKWPEATPLKNRSSNDLATWFHREIVCRYGMPEIVRTDNGGEFMGQFHDYLIQQNIQHILSSPYHPQTQGQVERMHETIKGGIRRMFNTDEYRDQWDQILPNVLLGIRTSVSRATGLSPSQLLMGRSLSLPGHPLFNIAQEYQEPTPGQIQNYFLNFQDRQNGIYQQVQQQLARMDVEICQTIDKRRKRLPKDLDYEDLIIIKPDPMAGRTALEVNAIGPMHFIEYTDRNRNVVRYFDPRTRMYGRASVANVLLLKI